MATSLVRRPDLFGRIADWLDMPEFGRYLDGPQFADIIKIEQKAVNGKLEIRAEMPGIDPDEDVEITMADSVLRISAERKEETKSEERGRFRSEFRYGRFVRQVPLPAGATMEDVKATYKDGILEVRVPVRSEKAEATKVPITRG